MKPGIFPDINIDDYHADKLTPEPSLSSSTAKVLLMASPLHAWTKNARLNPAAPKDDEPEESSDPAKAGKFDLGSAAHDALLEGGQRIEYLDPRDFAGPRGGIPKGWTNDAIKAARDAARQAGRTPVLLRYKQPLEDMVAVAIEAIAKCPQLDGLALADGHAEQSIYWQEAEGIWCRCRPDWITPDLNVQISYKSTATSARPSVFARQVGNMGYDLQDAFYLRGARAIGASEGCRTITLVQENVAPYACVFFDLDPEWMDMAHEKAQTAIDIWTQCLRSGKWPAYPAYIHTLDAPVYLKHDWEGRPSMSERTGAPTYAERVRDARLLGADDLADGVPL